MMYFLVVVWTSYRYDRRTGVIASILSILCFDFFLVPPYLSFRVSDTEYFITFIGMLIVSLFISTITGRLGSQTRATRKRETRLSTLYKLSRTLGEIPEPHAMLQAAWQQLHDFSKVPVLLLTQEGAGSLRVSAGDPQQFGFSGNDVQAAEWVFRNGELAGRGTDTLPAASIRCHPLRTSKGLVGVLGVHPKESGSFLTPEQRQTLAAFANQAALAIEGASLAEQARQAELLRATESLQTALLNSISHDLRTPLVSITGALSSLDEDSGMLNESARRALIENARGEADRLLAEVHAAILPVGQGDVDEDPLARDLPRPGRRRQGDLHATLQHGGRHHEDDEEDEHHVHQRNDVDLGKRGRHPARAGGTSAGPL
jgi:two-component system sensor histidine kinase KdpD